MAWGGGNSNSVDSWCKRLIDNDSTFTSLHILSFRRITTAELKRLFVAIQNNSMLQELYASGHGLDRDSMQALAEALKHNTTLRRLNIGQDTLGSQGELIEILASGLASNQGLVRLDLENKGLGGHDHVQALIQALDGTECRLKELNLARNKLTDQDVVKVCQGLGQNRYLEKLDLCLNSFSTVGSIALAGLLSSQAQESHGLIEVDVSDNEISEEGGVAIGQSLKTNKRLKNLRLSNAMDPPLPKEEEEDDSILFDQTLEQLQTELRESDLDEIRSDGDAVLEAISQSLEANSSLHELWMDYANVTSIGAKALGTALKMNRSLQKLHMRNNRIGNRGARYLGAALTPSPVREEHNSTLLTLELGVNKIGDLGWQGLVGAIGLESLGLYDNQVHKPHQALDAFAQTFTIPTSSGDPASKNPLITPISPSNGFTLSGKALSNLSHLDVGCNGISREDFTSIGVSLIKGLLPSLTLLEIAGNGDRKETGGHEGDGDDNEQTGEEEQSWERVANRIEEARPKLSIHWKGALGQGEK